MKYLLVADLPTSTQKNKSNMSGAEFQRTKEAQAAIMQEKQRKGLFFFGSSRKAFKADNFASTSSRRAEGCRSGEEVIL
jgi:hypothetical protein